MSTPTITAHNLNLAIAARDAAAADEAKRSTIWRSAQTTLAKAKLEEDETRIDYLLSRNATNRANERLEAARQANQQAEAEANARTTTTR
jgi:hypothetical protein